MNNANASRHTTKHFLQKIHGWPCHDIGLEGFPRKRFFLPIFFPYISQRASWCYINIVNNLVFTRRNSYQGEIICSDTSCKRRLHQDCQRFNHVCRAASTESRRITPVFCGIRSPFNERSHPRVYRAHSELLILHQRVRSLHLCLRHKNKTQQRISQGRLRPLQTSRKTTRRSPASDPNPTVGVGIAHFSMRTMESIPLLLMCCHCAWLCMVMHRVRSRLR